MAEVCLVSKDGKLVKIKEVSDVYRYYDYQWEETDKK